MKKNANAKNMLSGALILIFSGIFCKFLGAFYRIPLSNILGSEGIGLYQLVFPVFSLFLILSSGGIPVALSKIVSKCNARGENERAKRFLKIAFTLSLILSSIFSMLFLILNKQIASIQGNIDASSGYIAIVFALVFASILSVYRGYFQGLLNMFPTAVSQILEQVIKLVFGLAFAFYLSKFSLKLGVFGALLGIGIGEIISFVYIYFLFLLKNKKKDIIEPVVGYFLKDDLSLFVRTAFPITLNLLILPLILALDSFLVVRLLIASGINNTAATAEFGLYSGVVNSLINFPTVFAIAFSTAIIPTLSYNEEKKLKSTISISLSLKIVLIISVFCVSIFFLFAPNIISILYPRINNLEELKIATTLLRISCINVLFLSFIQISTSAMQAVGKSYIPLFNLAISGIIKVFFTFILVPSSFGIYGAAISSLLCYLLCFGLNYISLKELFNIKLEKNFLIFNFLTAVLSISATVGVYNLCRLAFHSTLSFIISLFVGIVLFIIFLFIFPLFSNDELKYVPFGRKFKSLN